MCSSKPSRPAQPYRNDPAVQRYYNPNTPGDEWEKWESAYYMYQKEETTRLQNEQLAMQAGFMSQQAQMQREQMALQERLQQQQTAAQQQLQAMQEEMSNAQMAQQREIEQQRLSFEKDAELMQRDAARKMDATELRSKQQASFQAGRDSRNRKNAGSLMASKGTKALQIGLNTGESAGAGLAIPT